MFFSNDTQNQAKSILESLNRSQAVIEFKPDGTILTANDNFLGAMGYELGEVQGKHHRMFVEASYAESDEYRDFWGKLAAGEFFVSEYKRIGKGGNEVWIQASYNPVFAKNGQVAKVVKFATDVTAEKLKRADTEGQIEAIYKSTAVIEFEPDGTILWANDNFLGAMGYTLDQVKGQHHRIFVESSDASSPAYTQFWEKLARGDYQTGEFKRIGKSGDDVWIQASYNPIRDMNGRVFKVVKFATDITDQVNDRIRKQDVSAAIDRDLNDITGAVTVTAEQAQSAAAASDRASETVQTVAASSEELAASVADISQQLSQALEISDQAVSESARTNEIVSGLAASVGAIGDVVDLINEIAEQTNLLALNATIESARAGEAGKGFAVVASEVKNLAGQTAKATDDIRNQIGEVQGATENAVGVISSVGDTISRINEISNAIASAVEEQSAVTQEVSQNMQSASASVDGIRENISEIASATQGINDSVRTVKEQSRSLV